jgi:hypothetical protein
LSESIVDAEPQVSLPAESTQGRDVPFFLVGVPKFIVMNLLTLGMYQFYWWYRHWVRLRDQGGEDVWPWARVLFANVFAYFFFDRVNEEADRQGTPTLLSPPLLAIAYFVALTSHLLGAPEWVQFLVPVAILAFVQSVINGLPAARDVPRIVRNTRFSLKNWGAVAACPVLLVLYTMPDAPEAPAAPSAPAEVVTALAPLVDDLNAQLPQPLAGGMALERVETNPEAIGLFVRLTQVTSREAIAGNVLERAQRQLLQLACASQGLEQLALDNGVALRYTILDQERSAFATMLVTSRAQCAATGE